jgi:hypothetical protein
MDVRRYNEALDIARDMGRAKMACARLLDSGTLPWRERIKARGLLLAASAYEKVAREAAELYAEADPDPD